MTDLQYFESACYLFDGGWRSTDRDELIEEYNITETEADKICEILASFEED